MSPRRWIRNGGGRRTALSIDRYPVRQRREKTFTQQDIRNENGGATLHRYTNVMSLIDLLTNRQIALTRTAHWADRNDHLALADYGQRMGGKTVFAICLTEAQETFHHWQIFAGGQTGVCIAFDKAKLAAAVAGQHLSGSVRYLKFDEARVHPIRTLDELPFLKRAGFRDEKEYRIVALSDDDDREAIPCRIPLEAIRRITFSPFVPGPLIPATRALIARIDGCAQLDVRRSLLTSNPRWLQYLRKMQPADA